MTYIPGRTGRRCRFDHLLVIAQDRADSTAILTHSHDYRITYDRVTVVYWPRRRWYQSERRRWRQWRLWTDGATFNHVVSSAQVSLTPDDWDMLSPVDPGRPRLIRLAPAICTSRCEHPPDPDIRGLTPEQAERVMRAAGWVPAGPVIHMNFHPVREGQ